MNRSFFVRVSCPKCRHTLMDHVVYIHYKPSIKLHIETQGSRITAHLSSKFSCHERICDVTIPSGEVNEFYCPHCFENLRGSDHCSICGAPMTSLNLDKGGRVVFCSRNGCHGEYLAFEEVSEALLNFSYNNPQETGEFH